MAYKGIVGYQRHRIVPDRHDGAAYDQLYRLPWCSPGLHNRRIAAPAAIGLSSIAANVLYRINDGMTCADYRRKKARYESGLE